MTTNTTKIAGEAMTDAEIIEIADSHMQWGKVCYVTADHRSILAFARALLASKPVAIDKEAVRCRVCNGHGYRTAMSATGEGAFNETCVYCGGTGKASLLDKEAAVTREEIERARDHILEQSKNSLFRSGVKICAGEILSPTEPCDKPPAGWTCSRIKGHEGPCAASPTAPAQSCGDAEQADEADVYKLAGYLVDPGAGSARDRFQTWKPDAVQLADLQRRGGSVTELFIRAKDSK